MEALSGNHFFYMRAIYEAKKPVCTEECVRLVYELYGIKHSSSTAKTIISDLILKGYVSNSYRAIKHRRRTFYSPVHPIGEFYLCQLQDFFDKTFLGNKTELMEYIPFIGDPDEEEPIVEELPFPDDCI